MTNWKQFPLFRLLIPFVIGIILALFFTVSFIYSLSVGLIFFVLLIYSYARKYKYSARWYFGIYLNLFLIIAGIIFTNLSSDISEFEKNKHILSGKTFVRLQLLEQPIVKVSYTRVTAGLKEVKIKGKWQSISGFVQLNIKNDVKNPILNYGDNVLVFTDFKEVAAPSNPSQFNYKKYLSTRQIFLQAFLHPGQWVNLQRNEGNFLKSASYKMKEWVLMKLKQGIPSKEEYAVVSGLLIGDTSEIDKDLVRAFSHTGVIHILSVSGMHVGIIYAGLVFFLRILKKGRWQRIFKMVILVGILWFYALLTGFSPAVIRAAAMLSFVIIGDSFRKSASIYNSIAASAFLLLIYDPFFLLHVGFQLSYLAVLGIVFLYQNIYQWYSPSNIILDRIWKIIAVSIAAQLATFPLVLFYFQQFPNYFILANIVAIPISTAIIYAGLISIFFAFWNPLFIILSKITQILTLFLNASIKWFNLLPFSVTETGSLSIIECILFYLFIIFLTGMIMFKNRKLIFGLLSIGIFLFTINIAKAYSSVDRKKIIIYNISKSSAYDFISRDEHCLVIDSVLKLNPAKLEFACKMHWQELGLKDPKVVNFDERKIKAINSFCKSGGFIQFYSRKILIIDEQFQGFNNNEKLQLDYVILRKNIKVSLTTILTSINVKNIIIDSSNSFYATNKWMKESEKFKVRIHAVPLRGAYEINL